MALPTFKDVKRHFQKNYKLYFAIGLALLIALGLFLLTLFCPPVAFFAAGTLGFLGWEAATAFSTLAIAGIMAGIGAVASLFSSIVANVSHRIKSYFDKKWIKDLNVYILDVDDDDDSSESNIPKLMNDHGYNPEMLEPVPDVTFTDFNNENNDVFFLKKKDANITCEKVVVNGLSHVK